MRIAALYDIHGNLPALEAVLADVRRAGVDRIVAGGDVLPGPMPHESLAMLRALDVPVDFIRGNGDRCVLEEIAGVPFTLPEAIRPAIAWNAGRVSGEERRFIASWPETLTLNADGIGDTLFCHATPRNDVEIFTRMTAEDRLAPVFTGVTAPLVVCGHTHMPFDRVVGRQRVVNSGSVGMPFGAPGADWLLLGPDIGFRHTNYDLEDAARRIRATDYPDAESFAAQYVLNPPSEARMLDVFTAASLAKK